MLCESCKKNTAVIHFQQIIEGKKTEYHLCNECALKMNVPFSFDNMVQSFLGGFMNNFAYTPVKENKDLKNNEEFICPECKYTFNEFKETGKLGCAECYNKFKNQLDSVFKNIHGSNVHSGKFPKKSGAKLLIEHKIENLKAELRKAVEREEYEEAAKLRDEIKRIEKGE